MSKKLIGPIVTPIITSLILFFVFYILGIFDHPIFISDLYAEYYPSLSEMQRIFTGNSSFIYNFTSSMGDNFIGTFYYYMSSPFNLLSIFIKDINILTITLIFIKIALASSCAYLFFRYQFKEEKYKYLIPISIFYAISSFSICYFFHIMWLDIYMIFPIILLGIDKIIKEKKHLLFILSLFYSIFCNYYFAYMICVFAFLYYNYKLLLKYEVKKDIKLIIKENIHFIIVGLLTTFIASIILIPIISEIGLYSRENSSLFAGEKLSLNFNLYNFIDYSIIGNYNHMDFLNANSFYTYSTLLTIPLLYFYFINKNIPHKEKLLSLIIILIFILSMSINYLNYFWHGLVAPSFFNGRYTFMFILFILLLSIKSLYNYNSIKTYHYFIILIVTIIFASLTYLNRHLEIIDVLKLVIFILYIFLLKKMTNNNRYYFIFAIVIFYEICFNCWGYIGKYNNTFISNNDLNNIQIYNKNIEYIKKTESDLFYRIEDNNKELINTSTLFNYHGIDYFISTIKKDLVYFFINLNLNNHSYTKNTIKYDGSNFIVSSLLNIKYYIECNQKENIIYKPVYIVDENHIVYKNNYALNLGYMVNDDVLKPINITNNGLEYLNTILNNMLGTKEDILIKEEVTKIDNLHYRFTNNRKDNYYLLVTFKDSFNHDSLKVYINGELITEDNNSYYYHVINNNDAKEINITLTMDNGDEVNIDNLYIYYYDLDKFKDSIKLLKKQELHIIDYQENYIKGKINVTNKGILFTSIPYNKNWDIYVDSKIVDKEKIFDAFIGIQLDSGNHIIEFKYNNRIIYLSFVISFVSSIIMYLYLRKYKKNK